MGKTEVENLFGNISRIHARRTGSAQCHTDEEWNNLGVKLFKRRVLGFCGIKETFSFDGLVRVLCNNNVAENEDEAVKLVPELVAYTSDQGLKYGHHHNYLVFRKVISPRGSEEYMVLSATTDFSF